MTDFPVGSRVRVTDAALPGEGTGTVTYLTGDFTAVALDPPNLSGGGKNGEWLCWDHELEALDA